MNAIETRYKGAHFRSRLEARWAIFFDSIGVRWSYEHEGYSLPSGNYLPDFFFPELKFWVEIKGERPTAIEQTLCDELAIATARDCFLFWGDVPYKGASAFPGFGYETDSALKFFGLFGGQDVSHLWCQCRECGHFGIEFSGWANRLPCAHQSADRYDGSDSPALTKAYEQARSARFERGAM